MPEVALGAKHDDCTPNAFIVGPPKCATTSIASWLSEHENVFVSNPKEPSYLAQEYTSLARQYDIWSDADYHRLFSSRRAKAADVRVDASTVYLRSPTFFETTLTRYPNARFIAGVRDPVDIAYAFHMEQVWNLNEPETDFETAWRLGSERTNRGREQERFFLDYREVARIGQQLYRARKHAKERLHIYVIDDLERNPRDVYNAILGHLGLDSADRNAYQRVNESKKHRSPWLAKAVLRPPRPVARPMAKLRQRFNRSNSPVASRIKDYLRTPYTRPPLAHAFRNEIRAELSAEVALLEELLDRDLQAAWGYRDA